MGRKAKWNASYAMHQIGNQSWVMSKMGMQMIYLFSSSPFCQNQQINEVDGLKKALPTAAGSVAFIDPSIRHEVNKGTDISLEMQPGYLSVLV